VNEPVRREREPVIAVQCACEKVDGITAFAAFVAVLVPLLSFMSKRKRRRNWINR